MQVNSGTRGYVTLKASVMVVCWRFPREEDDYDTYFMESDKFHTLVDLVDCEVSYMDEGKTALLKVTKVGKSNKEMSPIWFGKLTTGKYILTESSNLRSIVPY